MADGSTPLDTKQSEKSKADENWQRYQYGRDRGHDKYCERARRLDDYFLGGGEQWSEQDKQALPDGRMPIEFNEVLPAVKAAIGYQIANRMDISYRPRGGQATQEIANVLSKVAMQVMDNCDFHHKETDSFSDGMIQQRGYLDLRLDFDDTIRGEAAIDVLDPADVIPDPDAKGYDPDTWGDVIITRWITLDQIEERYGREAREKAELGLPSGTSLGSAASGDTDFGDDDSGEQRSKFGDSSSGSLYDAYRVDKGCIRLRVIDRQWFVSLMSRVVISPETGDVRTIEGMDPTKVAILLERGWIQTKRMAKRVRWRVSTYDSVLHDTFSPFPWLSPIPFYPIFRRGRTRGMVDNAIGPQDALNKLGSQFIHIVNTTANSGWTVEENSLTNMEVEDLEDRGGDTGVVIEHKKGQKPEKIEPNQVPPGVDRMIQILRVILKENTVPDAARGIDESGQESGKAIQSRQFAAQQQMTLELDNLGRSRNILAKRLLWLVQNYYDDQRIFRIAKPNPETGEDEEEVIEINVYDEATDSILNDVTLGEYAVVVSETPIQITFDNGQFEQAKAMKELIGDDLPNDVLIRTSSLADKNEIIRRNAKRQKQADPLVEAEVALKQAQGRKADADATARAVEAQFSALQTGQIIAQMPETAPLADALLRSAGYTDHDAPPIVPQPTTQALAAPGVDLPRNTNPLTPLNPTHPDIGMMHGIEGGA